MSSRSLAELIVEQATRPTSVALLTQAAQAMGGAASFLRQHESQVAVLAREMASLDRLAGRTAFEAVNLALAHHANFKAAIDAVTRPLDISRIIAATTQLLTPNLEHVASFDRAMLTWESSAHGLFEFLRHPPDRLCCGWAHDATLDLEAPRSTPECKQEAWDYLLDFTVTRLRLSESDAIGVMRALRCSGWRKSSRPYEYLRTVVLRRAARERRQVTAGYRECLSLDDAVVSNEVISRGDLSVEPRPQEERLVLADFERAFRLLSVPEDARHLLLLRYEGVAVDEMADFLNWDDKRVQRVLRSLNGDRRLGRALRRHFRSYRSKFSN